MKTIKLAIRNASGYGIETYGHRFGDRYRLQPCAAGLLIIAGITPADRLESRNADGMAKDEAEERLDELYANWEEVEINLPLTTPHSPFNLLAHVKEGGTFKNPQPGPLIFNGAAFIKADPNRDNLEGVETPDGILYYAQGSIQTTENRSEIVELSPPFRQPRARG